MRGVAIIAPALLLSALQRSDIELSQPEADVTTRQLST